MIPHPDPTAAAAHIDTTTILYACVAHGPTVLSEFLSSDDPSLAGVASRCLSSAPPLHRHYSHAAQGRTYAFLFSDPLVFFAVAPDSLVSSSSHLLLLLRCLRDAVLRSPSSSALQHPPEHLSLQNELFPLLRSLATQLPPGRDAIPHPPPVDRNLKPESNEKEKHFKKGKKGKKEKKSPPTESRMSISDDHHRFGKADRGIGIIGVKQAQRMWRRQVQVVLLIDVVVCMLLFGIWLSVCRGFQCIVR